MLSIMDTETENIRHALMRGANSASLFKQKAGVIIFLLLQLMALTGLRAILLVKQLISLIRLCPTLLSPYMRELQILAPADCIVSNTVVANDYALRQMKAVLKADIRPSSKLIFATGARKPRARRP
jgi:hypothetical protein